MLEFRNSKRSHQGGYKRLLVEILLFGDVVEWNDVAVEVEGLWCQAWTIGNITNVRLIA